MGDVLGIDIGGSGIKGAPVDLGRGELAGDRLRVPTPAGAKPHDVAAVVAQVVGHFGGDGPVGCTFPAVVQGGVARTAANVDRSWIGTDVAALFEDATGRPFVVLNDADLAGLAEMRFGVGKGRAGVVLVLTLGTGIGSALFTDGQLVPNTELGHLVVGGKEAEARAADSVRERHGLSWKKYAQRLGEVVAELDRLLWPDLVVLGGGLSKKADRFVPLLDVPPPVMAARLQNEAGIVGAALAAAGEAGSGSTGRLPRAASAPIQPAPIQGVR